MTIDFAVVGAGPAGMAAAVLAAELGLDTLLVDEQPAPGGQIYRAVERGGDRSPLGDDYLAGRDLVTLFRQSTVTYRPETTLWHIEPDGTLWLADGAGTERVPARRVLLATGAIERPVPIPGWTLPGVMTVGAAQILLKTADTVPEGRAVLAGQGPLLYLAALQLAGAGAPPLTILETTPHRNYHAATGHLGGWWAGRHLLAKGLRLLFGVRRAGIPIRHGVRGLRVLGRDRVEAVAWDGGELAIDHLFLHEGVIPNTQIGMALQLGHRWDEAQLCWRPILDEWGRTSIPDIAIAGDGGGIFGAEAAALSGRLAALDAAAALGRITDAERDRRATPIRTGLARECALRPFLDTLYRPAVSVLVPPDDDTIACRCEEVTVGRIRAAVRLGAPGPNQLKAFTRCGMGPCQGRICGPIVSAVIAAERGVPIAEIGAYRPRAPYKPITVGAVAGLPALTSAQEIAHTAGGA
ncbi:MAG TPA: FAD-dependent oxidoreductase [Stellaceae bacterium]|jgi:NADPH-dependent 2,4-dienoyl-CoA reductase/sulfur reductase-like enzyme|nr:FAD-dependent oxidoreductase [Stellaceae bacterium]